MGIFADWLNRRRQKNFIQTMSLSDSKLLEFLGIDQTNTKAISEATYYTCIRLLAETIGKLPWHYYQDTDNGRIRAKATDMSELLTLRPNPYMTPSSFWQTTEQLCQEYGNAFVWVESEIVRRGRYGGDVHWKNLWIMRPQDVTIWIDDKGIFGEQNALHYQYTNPNTGESVMLDASEVLHFKTWYSKDGGITGEPIRVILRETIDTLGQSQKVLNNQYKQGMTASMVMQYTGDLDDERIKKLQKKFADKLTSPENAGKVVPIPIGLQLQKLDQTFADSQFYELKKYTATQIAAAFGIAPVFLGIYEKASYASSEAQMLQFLVNTMAPRIKMYEEEVNWKCLLQSERQAGFFYRMNEGALLRTDSKTQEEIIVGYVNNGVYTPNEARRLLQLPDGEGGDVLMCNGNYIPITQVGAQYNNSSVIDGG